MGALPSAAASVFASSSSTAPPNGTSNTEYAEVKMSVTIIQTIPKPSSESGSGLSPEPSVSTNVPLLTRR